MDKNKGKIFTCRREEEYQVFAGRTSKFKAAPDCRLRSQ